MSPAPFMSPVLATIPPRVPETARLLQVPKSALLEEKLRDKTS